MFHGSLRQHDVLRIGQLNGTVPPPHPVNRGKPGVIWRTRIAQDHAGEEEKYTARASPRPFAAASTTENTLRNLLQIDKTQEDGSCCLALFPCGCSARRAGRGSYVPDGVLFGSSKAHKELRRSSWKTRSSTQWCRCLAVCSSLRRAFHPICLHEGPIWGTPSAR